METITSQPVMLEDADLDLVTGGSTNIIGAVGGVASIGDSNFVAGNDVYGNYAYNRDVNAYNTYNY